MSTAQKEIAGKLAGLPWVKSVQYLETVDSTNEYCRRLLFDCGECDEYDGLLVIAAEQSKGRGRGDNIWVSPLGGLYFSFVKSRIYPSCFSLIVGLSVAEAIEKRTSLETHVKWPNDIMQDGKKISGILIQTLREKTITGIGINTSPAKQLPFDNAAHIELAGMSERAALLRDFFYILNRHTERFEKEGFEPLREIISRRLAFLGEPVAIKYGDTIQSGLFAGIGQDGEALVEIGDKVLNFYSGSLLSENQF